MSRAVRELKKLEERMVTKDDLEALIDTVEILSKPLTMEALRKSDQNIKEGRTREISSVEDMLSEM